MKLERKKGWQLDRPREVLALAMIRAGRTEAALKMATQIMDIAGRARVLGGVVEARIEAGRLDDADGVYQRIKADVGDGIGGSMDDIVTTGQLVRTTLPRAT